MLLALVLVHINYFHPPWNIFCYFKAQYIFFQMVTANVLKSKASPLLRKWILWRKIENCTKSASWSADATEWSRENETSEGGHQDCYHISEMDGFRIKKESALSKWGLVSSPLKASWGIKSPLDWETVGQVEEGETKMEPFDRRTKTTGTCLLGTIRHKQNISPVKQGGGIMLRR